MIYPASAKAVSAEAMIASHESNGRGAQSVPGVVPFEKQGSKPRSTRSDMKLYLQQHSHFFGLVWFDILRLYHNYIIDKEFSPLDILLLLGFYPCHGLSRSVTVFPTNAVKIKWKTSIPVTVCHGLYFDWASPQITRHEFVDPLDFDRSDI